MRNALAWLRSFPCRRAATSVSIVRRSFKKGAYDFVYLDARHDYKGVVADLNAYWPLLRRGGIMAGHDYIWATEGGRNGRAKKGSSSNDYTINLTALVTPSTAQSKALSTSSSTRSRATAGGCHVSRGQSPCLGRLQYLVRAQVICFVA